MPDISTLITNIYIYIYIYIYITYIVHIYIYIYIYIYIFNIFYITDKPGSRLYIFVPWTIISLWVVNLI